MARVVASALRNKVAAVTLVGDTATYSGLGFPVIPDAAKGAGPLGGIVAALQHTRWSLCVVAACDMPRVESAPLERMLREAARSQAEAVVPRTPDGRLQPLLAVYAKRATEPLAGALRDGRWKLTEALNRIAWHEFPVADQGPFLNVNRVRDLDSID